MRLGPVFLCLFALACSGSHGRGDAGVRMDAGGGGMRDGGSAVLDAASDAGDGLDVDVCSMPTDCIVVPATCCGSCGAASRGDARAIHRDQVATYRQSVCRDDVDCPGCFMEPDPTLIATCEAGRCQLVDLQMHPATECADASECRVRAVECCECGATIQPSTVVTISNPAAFEPLVCDPTTGCPECAPVYPMELRAACQMGRCVVASTLGP